MKFESKVEVVEKTNGQILSRIKLGNKDFFSRQVPIGNRVSFLEDRRVNGFNREPFNTAICFSTVPFFKDLELKEYLKQYNCEMFKQKSNKDRICLSSLQRNDDNYERMDKDEAFNALEAFAESKVENVPIEIPLHYNLISWKKLKKDAESVISPNQNLIADVHCFQDHNHIRDILQFEIDEGSGFFFIACRTVNNPDNLAAYGQVWNVTRKLKEGNHVPIIVGKNISRYQSAYGNVSSTFGLNCFNIGVVAERFYLVPKEQRKEHNKHGPDDYCIYDPEEGAFVKTTIQKLLNKRDLVRDTLNNNNLMQGVSPYEAMLCSNFILQQEDTFMQNDLLTKGRKFSSIVLEKTQWSSFYTNCVKPHLSSLA